MKNYDGKREAYKDFLYTGRVLLVFIFIAASLFMPLTLEKGKIYTAINLSPIKTEAKYIRSEQVYEHVVYMHYQYETDDGVKFDFVEKVLTRYSDEREKLNNAKSIQILYSKYFPSISYLEKNFNNLKGDYLIFIVALSVMFICFCLFVIFNFAIYW